MNIKQVTGYSGQVTVVAKTCLLFTEPYLTENK